MKKLDLMLIGGGVALALGPFARAGMAMDASIYYGFQAEQFEYRVGDESEKRLVWDADAFVGTDELKLRWQGEGERDLD
ncbi:copper resistance protein B, partial [Thalassospira xiamenensis]